MEANVEFTDAEKIGLDLWHDKNMQYKGKYRRT
jgi:hypothetical protein